MFRIKFNFLAIFLVNKIDDSAVWNGSNWYLHFLSDVYSLFVWKTIKNWKVFQHIELDPKRKETDQHQNKNSNAWLEQ